MLSFKGATRLISGAEMVCIANRCAKKPLSSRIPRIAFGANVARIIRLSDLHTGQIRESR
jgi:hypothetical protein